MPKIKLVKKEFAEGIAKKQKIWRSDDAFYKAFVKDLCKLNERSLFMLFHNYKGGK